MVTANQSLLVDICNKLMSPDASARSKRPEFENYHSLIIYLAEIGVAVHEQPKKELNITYILLNLLSKLDLPARENMLNAIANEVRYPSSYTHYFIMFLLHLMEGSTIQIPFIQEQVFRILLERQTCSPPVPWGINILFSELRNNPVYDLPNKPFVKGIREIENILMRLKSYDQVKDD